MKRYQRPRQRIGFLFHNLVLYGFVFLISSCSQACANNQEIDLDQEVLIQRYLAEADSDAPSVRDRAIMLLRECGERGFSALVSRDREYVAQIVQLVGEEDNSKSVPKLLEIMQKAQLHWSGCPPIALAHTADKFAYKALVQKGPKIYPIILQTFLTTKDPLLKFSILNLLAELADRDAAFELIKMVDFPTLPENWQNTRDWDWGIPFVTFEEWCQRVRRCYSVMRKRYLNAAEDPDPVTKALRASGRLDSDNLLIHEFLAVISKTVGVPLDFAHVQHAMDYPDYSSQRVHIVCFEDFPFVKRLPLAIKLMGWSFCYTICDGILVIGPDYLIEAIDYVEVLLDIITDSCNSQTRAIAWSKLRQLVYCPLPFDPTCVDETTQAKNIRRWWNTERPQLLWNRDSSQFYSAHKRVYLNFGRE